MKTVYRRVLFSAFKNCRKENIKSVSLDGRTLSCYHPHGSCYGTIVGMVEDGLLIGKGNWGSHMGVFEISAAAPRYTEVKLNPISEILFLNPELLPHVDWKKSDLGFDEPEFLPVLIPPIMTALGETSMMDVGTGVHLKNQYPKFSAMSLLNYTIHYLKTGKFNKKLLEFKFMNLTKPFGDSKEYDDTSYKFNETFKAKFEEDKNGTYVITPLPDFNMETKLTGIPYKDYSKESTRIFIPSKYFDEKLFESKVHFSSFAYTGNEDSVIIHPYSIQIAIKRIVENFRQIVVPRYFQDEIDKITLRITELEILLRIARKISKSGKKIEEVYADLTDAERIVANSHTVSAMLKLKGEDISKLEAEKRKIIEQSKDADGYILQMYLNAKSVLKEYEKK